MADLVRVEGRPTEDGPYWLWLDNGPAGVDQAPRLALVRESGEVWSMWWNFGKMVTRTDPGTIVAHARIPLPFPAPIGDTFTAEIETRDGNPPDLDSLQNSLDLVGMKWRRWSPGSHLLARGRLREALDNVRSALLLAQECSHTRGFNDLGFCRDCGDESPEGDEP